jgi:hypothetical protein
MIFCYYLLYQITAGTAVCLDNRNKTFPVEMALVEAPQILEAEIGTQIIDYNQRVAPIFVEKAMAKKLIRQVK